MKVTGKFTPNKAFFKKHEKAKQTALEQTAEALLTDLVESKTMPFDTGALQNHKTFVDYAEARQGKVAIKHQGPYARRLYYHPEYNFQRSKNPHAGALWLEPYLKGGTKEKFAVNSFRELYKGLMGL